MTHPFHLSEVDVIIGVDQTGARKNQSQAKPLPMAFLLQHQRNWTAYFHDQMFLPSFHRRCIDETLGCFLGRPTTRFRIFAVVDCVLGLPEACQKHPSPCHSLTQYIDSTTDFEGFGLKTSEEFFNRLVKDLNLPPNARRRAEVQLGAQSVFTSKPWQRNIQTGTFRIWKDLAQNQDWKTISLWPLSQGGFTKSLRTVVAEGYPSLAWRQLNQSSRTIKNLSNTIKRFNNIEKMRSLEQLQSSGHRDAAFLALQAFHLIENQGLRVTPHITIEGGILGAD